MGYIKLFLRLNKKSCNDHQADLEYPDNKTVFFSDGVVFDRCFDSRQMFTNQIVHLKTLGQDIFFLYPSS